MSRRGPVRVAERHQFDAIIDARSPAEYALDHIPERRIVGTLYKQQGAFEARRVGGAMVAANLARHLRERFANHPASWKPLVYCWRGGMRSGSMVTWLRLVGWDAQQLAGGYKPWRHHVIETLDRLAPLLPLRVICGATGSAKTRVLQALQAQGEQVLDLEGLACHKGSMLGALPDRPQPSQKGFETQLASVLESLDLGRTVYVEAESRKIGRIALPTALVERLRASPCTEIVAPPAARLDYLVRDYAYLGDDGPALAALLESLKERHGKETVSRWQAWALQGRLPELFGELAELHYDPHYDKSQASQFSHWDQRQSVPATVLDDAGIAALAKAVAALA